MLSLPSFCGHIIAQVLSCILYIDIICTGYCLCYKIECYSQFSFLYVVILSHTNTVIWPNCIRSRHMTEWLVKEFILLYSDDCVGPDIKSVGFQTFSKHILIDTCYFLRHVNVLYRTCSCVSISLVHDHFFPQPYQFHIH